MYGTGFFPTDRSNIYALEADGLYPHRHVRGRARLAPHGGDPRGGRSRSATRASRRASAARRARPARTRAGCSASTSSTRSRCSSSSSPDESWAEHERMLELEESSCQALGLPYRVVNVAAGDSAPRRRRSTTSRRGSRSRSATARSRRARTRPTTRRAGSGSATAAERGLETPHTLNGTMVTDRALLAILENFQGDVPDVLSRYGAPARGPFLARRSQCAPAGCRSGRTGRS